jgi:anti-anti-sigma factor
MAVVPELRHDLDVAIEGGCAHLVLDFAEVLYADSSALGLLVWLDHRLRPGGGRMILAGANDDITRILELSGLVTVASSLAMSPDVSTALNGLNLSDEPSAEQWREELIMRAAVEELGSMREKVCELIRPLGFSESAVFDIRVALGEALANAVRHGSPDGGEAEVVVKVIAYSDRVVMEIIDFGSGFDGTPHKSRDVYAPGGRGVTFMRALTDRVEFEKPESGGTLVRLVKHRPGGNG